MADDAEHHDEANPAATPREPLPLDHVPLDQVQRWLQAVITHPDGVVAGVDSEAARREIPLGSDRVEEIIGRSEHLTSLERLAVYGNAYYARLLECLRDSFPILCATMGEGVFNRFAFAYLQKCPSQSYTLGELGARLADHLDATRPAATDATSKDDGQLLTPDWPRFVVELARLEWTIGDVFDSPGMERGKPLTADDLAIIPPDRWSQTRLVLAPCVRLLAFQFPINDYYTAMRDRDDDDEAVPIPSPRETFLALHRRDYIVRRLPLSREQFQLLGELHAGEPLSAAIAAAFAESDLPDEELAATLSAWFAHWAAEQLFASVAAPS